MKIRIIILVAIFISLISIIPSPADTLAVAGCPQATGRRIDILNGSGFLSKTNDQQAGSQFSTPGSCLLGPQAAITPPSTITTYDELLSLYFTQSKVPDAQKITLPAQLSGNSPFDLSGTDKLYRITGDFLLLQNITIDKTGIIFVDGNLLIGSNLTHSNNNAGLIFIVKGVLYIDQNVTQVDSVLITEGQFCSSSAGSPPACNTPASPVSPLFINGSVIILTSDPTFKPKFVRTLADNKTPAETITYQPKYLAILKDIFSKYLTVWNEIQ